MKKKSKYSDNLGHHRFVFLTGALLAASETTANKPQQ